MYPRNHAIRGWYLVAAFAAVGCGSGTSSMDKLSEGVAGPFIGASVVDLTTLQAPENYLTFYTFEDFYIQAVVNGVKAGDQIVAVTNTTSTQQSFTAPQAGNLGTFFHFTPPGSGYWPQGMTTVTVTNGSRTIGSVTFALSK